jgi:ABC-type amino acid transport substrate-binding protein
VPSRIFSALVVLVVLAAACGDDGTPTPTDAASTTAPADLTTTPGVLSVGSDIPYEPFEYFDDAGNVLGFDADLITEIAERLGLTVEWTDTDFDTIFTQLSTGTYDVVISGPAGELLRPLLQVAAVPRGQHHPHPRHRLPRRPRGR